MKSCITCFYQGDNNVDVNGEGKVFCMIDCKWRKEQDFCFKFVDYADLSKEIRCQYAMKENGGHNIKSIIKANWYVMIATFIVAFITFLIVVKFFDRYIF